MKKKKKEYLNSKAISDGYKKGKDLSKKVLADAKKELKQGKIDNICADEELLEDIRDDFYR